MVLDYLRKPVCPATESDCLAEANADLAPKDLRALEESMADEDCSCSEEVEGNKAKDGKARKSFKPYALAQWILYSFDVDLPQYVSKFKSMAPSLKLGYSIAPLLEVVLEHCQKHEDATEEPAPCAAALAPPLPAPQLADYSRHNLAQVIQAKGSHLSCIVFSRGRKTHVPQRRSDPNTGDSAPESAL